MEYRGHPYLYSVPNLCSYDAAFRWCLVKAKIYHHCSVYQKNGIVVSNCNMYHDVLGTLFLMVHRSQWPWNCLCSSLTTSQELLYAEYLITILVNQRGVPLFVSSSVFWVCMEDWIVMLWYSLYLTINSFLAKVIYQFHGLVCVQVFCLLQ